MTNINLADNLVQKQRKNSQADTVRETDRQTKRQSVILTDWQTHIQTYAFGHEEDKKEGHLKFTKNPLLS